MKARFLLELSDANWENYPAQANDKDSRAEFTMELTDGPWVQFTYEGLRDVSSSPHVYQNLFFMDGFWQHDGRVFSDLVIEFVKDEE